MDNSVPSKDVLNAFGINEKPIQLFGGQHTSYKAGDLVLKPVENDEETIGISELMMKIQENGFRIAKPVKAKNYAWIYEGWNAHKFVEGKEENDRWEEKLLVSRKFHKALAGLPKPDFLENIANPWAIADKMIWGDLPLKYGEKLAFAMSRLKKLIKPISPQNQIIHGDMTGNILFDSDQLPAVIDLSLYWHPAKYAEAIIVVDSIVWYGAPDSLIDKLENNFDTNQLLVRAAMWRIKTKEEYISYFGKKGDICDVDSYQHLIGLIEKRVN